MIHRRFFLHMFLMILAGLIIVDLYQDSRPSKKHGSSSIASANVARPEAVHELTAAEKVLGQIIIDILREQRRDTLTPGLHEWVKENFISFEDSEDQGIDYSRSVAWGTGKYNSQELHWFAYTSPKGHIQMNLSAILVEKDVATITAKGKVKVRIIPMPGEIGMVTHLALSEGQTDWIREQKFCLKGETVCNTSGAFEQYLLAAANSAMPGKLTFELKGRFPY